MKSRSRSRRSQRRYLATLAFCLIVALIAILELLRIVRLPFDASYAFVQSFVLVMPEIAYVGLFTILLLENASLPIPGELLLPLAGYYVFVGRLSLFGVLAVSSLASLLGTLIIFSLALKFGAPVAYWWLAKIGVSQKTIARNEVRLCGKNGSALILVSRFVPILGAAIFPSAAALKMNELRLVGLSLIGSLFSASAYLAAGYYLGPILERNEQLLSSLVIQYVFYGMALALAIYLAYFALRKLKERRAKNIFLRETEVRRLRDW